MKENTPDILVTGAESMIGQYMGSVFPKRCILMSRKDLDISDLKRFVSMLDHYGPKVVVNAAGNAGGSREDLFNVNALYPANLAELCEKRGIPFYYLSSARVFGHGNDEPFSPEGCPCPVDDYGIAKYAGERFVRTHAKRCGVVVRMPMVLGDRKKNKDRQILFRLLEKSMNLEPVSVASDVIHSPIYAGEAATALMNLINDRPEGGIYHISGSETVSLHDLYCLILKGMQCDAPVIPVKASELSTSSTICLNQALKSYVDVNRSCNDVVQRFLEDVIGAENHD